MINPNPLVSVIVPIYKVEEYLDECVRSILQQTYVNLEIILVDDGSPDNCGKMCDCYAANDSRITVIHKENGGLSDARNAGTNIAKGQYIVFVDSDDLIEKDFIQYSIKLLLENNADLLVMPYRKFADIVSFGIECKDKVIVLDKRDCIRRMLMQDANVPVGAHSKVYKRELCIKHLFPKGKYYEDLATTYKMILESEKIVLTNIPRYGYRIRDNSIVREKFSERKMDMVAITDTLFENIIRIYPDLKAAVSSRCLSGNFTVFLQTDSNLNGKEQDILWSRIVKYRRAVMFGKDVRKKARCAAFVSYFGKNISRLVFLLFKNLQ
ncbi:MAG: glycosyltransferase [Lachnospiraceae bacterium]|nr:glycosyltransferase [Lachnospiraceae bacterium]